MEWPDFQCSPFNNDLSWYDLFTPEFEVEKPANWTFEENELLENALAEVDPENPAFFENVASRIPWKSIDEIKIHYQALVEDVEMIQSGVYPIPKYETDDKDNQDELQVCNEKESPSPVTKKTCNGQHRRRGVPWTEEEHQLFLMGLNKYGKGDWRSISRYYVLCKTPTQVASHAQKYFRRRNSSTPMDKRRPSIHDIQRVNPTMLASVPPTNTNYINNLPAIEEPTSFPSDNPLSMSKNNFEPNFNGQFGDFSRVQNPMFPPIDNRFLATDHMLNHSSTSYSPSCMFPSMQNQPWG
ncbi:transcription factor DIVARICATA-like [Olea europaea subsp. europaea]|uniref:Transcription factor DIVARICATA-like n=1 Tax=Olea europaea subsp. europaea TaxID=158383 RepID=A0A8S0TGH6_OLEEU|nr:transcription factor DIVARICATA-like [Olea europaea subsp. europaea]